MDTQKEILAYLAKHTSKWVTSNELADFVSARHEQSVQKFSK